MEARAKEVKKIVEGLILPWQLRRRQPTVKSYRKGCNAVKDKRESKRRLTEKKVTVHDEVEKEIKKDKPSRYARNIKIQVL